MNLRQHLARSGEALFPHQQQALHRIGTFLTQPVGSPIGDDASGRKRGDWCEIVSATGTGKTRMFGHLAQGMGQRTVILTPRNLLNVQTKREFCEEIGIDPDDVGVYDSKQTQRQKQLALNKQYLITTYQSLAALVTRGLLSPDPANPSYRPVVILDEAHTGQGYATARLIRSFLDTCFVAGFTATDAGAHETLFHGQQPIFELGIVPAVEQGLLCRGVKTGVLDVQIDEDWLHAFQRTTRGEYADEAVHRFARNPSIVKGAIEFHLTQDDEHLGRLHRLPTIFFTHGIDAAQLGVELFNRRAAELGINARADFISGDMSQNERDAKLERFKRGEIQALWNDRVLEMGFDDANATVCYSLKPSLMSATPTQQMGRITRRAKPDYAARFGQEKIALAINVRAPGMNPFLFGEVLGGRPAVYSTDHPPSQAESERLPSARPALPDVAVHLDYADMETVLSQAASQRQDSPKTEEWRSKNDLARDVGKAADNPAFSALWERIAGEFARRPEQPVVIDGHTVKCGMRQTARQAVFCVNTSETDWFKTKLGLATGKKTEEWLRADEFAKRVRVTQSHEAFDGLWQRIEAEYRAAPDRPVVIDGHPVRCGIRLGGRHVFCLHADEAAWFRSVIRPEEAVKTEDWLTLSDTERALRLEVGREDFRSLWAELKQAYDTNPDAPVVGDHAVRCGMKITGKKINEKARFFCVHRSELPWMAQRIGKNLPNRTEDWLPKVAFAQHLRMAVDAPEFDALWKRIEAELNRAPGEPVMIDGHMVNAQRMQSNTRQITCVNVSETDWFRQRLGKNLQEKTEGWLARAEFARHIHTSASRNPAFGALWKEIEAAFSAAPQEAVIVRGHRVQAQRMQSGARQAGCLHISEGDWFRHEMEKSMPSRALNAAEEGRPTWTEEVKRDGQNLSDTRDESRGR